MKEVLISVAGLTPQVITETLYYFTQVRKPPAKISEIWVITTVPGKQKVERALLHPGKGHFFQFCREYGLDSKKIRFSSEQILTVPDKSGRPLDDIRTAEDNAALADFITSFIRDKTADPNASLHCSVAGGRKTMGLYLGLGLQLYGRPGGSLSHVLVSPTEVEGDPKFYYPPKKPSWVNIKGQRLHSSRIGINLAEIPVMMLRGKIPALDTGRRSYVDLIRSAQQDYELLQRPPQAAVDKRTLSLKVGEREVRFSALETAVYLVFAEARLIACGQAGCPGCTKCTYLASDFLGSDGIGRVRAALKQLKPRDVRLEELRGWGARDPIGAEKRFREVRSRLNRKILQGLGGELWPAYYTIAALRLPGEDRVRYGIRLDPRLLKIG